MKCIYCGTAPINSTTNPELKVCCCYQLQRVKGIYKQHHRDGRITYPTMTNYEKIKAMSVEEMADFIDDCNSCSRCSRKGNNCFPTFHTKEWLESEVIEE